MIDEMGAIRQESLRSNPAMKEMRAFPFPLKGVVSAVYYKDDTTNATKQTLVDVVLMGGYSGLRKVPMMSSKTDASAGEEWTPEPGDIVVVMFVNGVWTDPLVVGYGMGSSFACINLNSSVTFTTPSFGVVV